MRATIASCIRCATVLGALVLLLAACMPGATPAALAPTQVPATVQAQPSPAAEPYPENGPAVIAQDQTYDGTYVVIAKVISQGPGWMAIHSQQDGHLGPVIGHAHVENGAQDNVIVKIDPGQATPTLYAMLHVDAGVIGTYEFPGPDVPVYLNGEMVSPAFRATVTQGSGTRPMIDVRDQDVAGGTVVVTHVVSNGPGWVAIHVQNQDGTPGGEIGYGAVRNGTTNNVVITIDPTKATSVLYVMLHVDAGEIGTYEYPGPDLPVIVGGQMVAPTFRATNISSASAATAPTAAAPGATDMGMTYMATGTPAAAAQVMAATAVPAPPAATAAITPTTTAAVTATVAAQAMVMATPAAGIYPVVRVADQVIQDGIVKVVDVVSSGPGWIVIYTDANGQPDQPIGHSPVKDGDNPDVMVQVDSVKATRTLYAQLHTDAGRLGVFEFPGPDAPVMLGVRMVSGQFQSLPTTARVPAATPAVMPAITVADQPIHDGAIVISQIVSTGDAWLVIHPQNADGSMGDYIGYAPVHDGANDNVVVRIDTSRASPVLYAMLHQNVSKGEAPQFPGVDVPVMVDGQMILPQFKVIGPVTGDVPINIAQSGSGGPHLTDGLGMSLYVFLNDPPGKSNCTGDCLNKFQPLQATSKILPAAGIAVDKLGVILLPNRTRQVTYGGAPLYYYRKDGKPGDTLGQGLDGLWFLVTP